MERHPSDVREQEDPWQLATVAASVITFNVEQIVKYLLTWGSRMAAVTLAVVVLTGCGDSGTEPETFNQIAGSYAGMLSGIQQGIALNATLSLTIQQNRGQLSGSYAISGTLSDGVVVVDTQGTGVIDGSIQSGNNPSVNVTITPGGCPNRPATFSGAYDSSNQRLTISGPVEIFEHDCSVFITYQSTIIMSR